MTNKVGISLLTLFVCFIVGVGKQVAQYLPSDDSILTQAGCAFPCWQGLVPGQSSIEDIRTAIANVEFISAADHLAEGAVDSSYVFRWYYDSYSASGKFITQGNVLQ